jgi:hypothetical protein
MTVKKRRFDLFPIGEVDGFGIRIDAVSRDTPCMETTTYTATPTCHPDASPIIITHHRMMNKIAKEQRMCAMCAARARKKKATEERERMKEEAERVMSTPRKIENYKLWARAMRRLSASA